MVGTKTTKAVNIEKRGTFHDDSFFRDSWDEWDKAMKDVVEKWDKETAVQTIAPPPSSETRTVYRQIRSSNVTSDDSQAVSCKEEEDKYKIMIDVKDFAPEDINVKAIEDTVVVEGKIEKKEGNAITTQTFKRRFLLPPGVNMSGVASALSRDGVLTINAPKLVRTPVLQERSVPISRYETASSSARSSSGICDKYFPERNTAPIPVVNEGISNPSKIKETVLSTVPEGRDTNSSALRQAVGIHSRDHWTTFNEMVEKSQKEMEEMMRKHTIQPTSHKDSMQTLIASGPEKQIQISPPEGVLTVKDIVQEGDKKTHREVRQWEDAPSPGMKRNNRFVKEYSTFKDDEGNILGNSESNQHTSHTAGSKEEILPDGTKVHTFTKNYETSHVYSTRSGNAKAL